MMFTLQWTVIFTLSRTYSDTHTSSTRITSGTESYCLGCSSWPEIYRPRTLFICYITCFVGNNCSSGGLFIAGRVLWRYSSMLHDCLITESHVLYHSTLWWDLRHGCLALFLCTILLPLSQCLQIKSQRQALATRPLIQSVSSPADPNPLTPRPNVWNLLP